MKNIKQKSGVVILLALIILVQPALAQKEKTESEAEIIKSMKKNCILEHSRIPGHVNIKTLDADRTTRYKPVGTYVEIHETCESPEALIQKIKKGEGEYATMPLKARKDMVKLLEKMKFDHDKSYGSKPTIKNEKVKVNN